MWVFDIKKEDKRRKARLVVGSHVIDASSLPTYPSAIQNLSICLLLLISKANNLKVATWDIGNACLNANVGESVCSRSGEEWGENNGCMLEIIKALCGLKISARQWSSCLGDALREMGFTPTHADPDLWMKASSDHSGYDHVCAFVDDLIVVKKQPLPHLEMLASKFNLRKITDSSNFFLNAD